MSKRFDLSICIDDELLAEYRAIARYDLEGRWRSMNDAYGVDDPVPTWPDALVDDRVRAELCKALRRAVENDRKTLLEGYEIETHYSR